jgi:transposase
MLKPDLYHSIKRNKFIHHTYKVNNVLFELGHTILRLQSELNPIEFIWGTVKNWVAKKKSHSSQLMSCC